MRIRQFVFGFVVVLSAVSAVAARQQPDADRVTVPLSDASRPALIEVSLTHGSITVRGTNRKDIVVTARPEVDRPRRRSDPDAAGLPDTHKLGWKGPNEICTKVANQSFQEALAVYRAAWRRGLTTPEIDKLANASSVGQRYHNGYWLKEKIFREIRAQLKQDPALDKELIRLYYLGLFDEYARKISVVPGR